MTTKSAYRLLEAPGNHKQFLFRRGAESTSFDRLRTNGDWIPFVVSLSNHERNGGVQHWGWSFDGLRTNGVLGMVLRRAQDERGLDSVRGEPVEP